MKIKYEIEEEDIKKVLADYFKVPTENIELKNRIVTEGYGVNEHPTFKIVAELVSEQTLFKNILP